MTRPTRRERLTAWVLVAVQGTLIAVVVIIPRDPAWAEIDAITFAAQALIVIALVLGAWGSLHLGRGLTPLPLPNGATELVTRGPYRWIRHPLYSAVIIGMFGIALRTRTPSVIAVAAGLAPFLAMKSRWEERHLRAAFAGYSDYAARTGRFIPTWRRDRA